MKLLRAAASNNSPSTSKSVRNRRFRASLASGIALSAAAAATPAYAAPNACGPAVAGQVTCRPDGNPYPTGIQYTTPGSLVLNLDPGVVVQAPTTFLGVSNFSTVAGGNATINAATGSTVEARVGLLSSSSVSGGNGTATVNSGADIRAAFGIQTQAAGASTINNTGSILIPLGPTLVSRGLTALSQAGNSTITNSGAITIQNNGLSEGILAISSGPGGQVQVTNSGAITVQRDASDATAIGIEALGRGTDSSVSIVNTGAIAISGANRGFGLTSFTNGNISINSTAPVTVTARRATGIFAETTDVDGTINVVSTGTITANSTADAAPAPAVNEAGGIYTTAIDGSTTISAGTVRATGSQTPGISAGSEAGSISITSGNVSTTGNDSFGIESTTTTGAVTVRSGSVSTTGAGSRAISVFSDSGTIDIGSTGAVSTTGALSSGIVGITGGNVRLSNTGSVTTTGVDSGAIFGFSTDGDVTITGRGTVSTAGVNSFGVVGAAVGDGNVSIQTGAVTTSGANAAGVGGASDDGSVTIDATSVRTAGQNSDAVDAASGTGNVRVATGTVATTGAGSIGIRASSPGGNVTVTSNNLSTTGAEATGILATSDTGIVTVTSTGALTTTGATADGIVATTTSGPIVVNSQSAIVTGAGSSAIVATSQSGQVTVNSGTARSNSGRAIVASSGSGAVNVTSGDASSVTSNAILATSTTGPASVLITGATRSTQGTAVEVQAGTLARVDLRAGGSVQGGVSGIVITAPVSSFVNNAGTITGGSGFAIDAAGGPIIIDNSGTITGRLRLTGGNDTIVNSGTFNATQVSQLGAGNDTLNNSGTFNANADFDFGAGTDTFNNSGTLRVLTGGLPAGTVNLTGLEAFNNSGLIDLRNGRTGDVLAIPGATFTGTGNSALGLDLNFGTNTSDRLVVGNAQGSTALLLTTTGDPGLGAGPVLVQASAASAPGAFTRPRQQAGLVQVDLVYNPGNFSFALVGTPSNVALRTTAFAGAFRDLWHESADAWSAQMREGRDTAFGGNAGDPGARIWIQGYARLSEREGEGSFTTFGQQRDVNLSYDQDFFGGQAGLDFGGAVGEQGGFAFGVTGGYTDSHVNFEGSGDDLQMRAVNVGAYGRFSTGLFFVNALGKYDHVLDVNTRSIIGEFATELDGNLYGAKLEAGLRLGGMGLWVEPIATIAYVKSDLDGFAVRGTSVDFDNDDGLRGSLGARIGSAFEINQGSVANLYAGAHYVHEFSGSDEVLLATGANSVRLASADEEDHVKTVVGINIAGAGAVSGFIEGNGEFLNDREGMGVRGGIRIRF